MHDEYMLAIKQKGVIIKLNIRAPKIRQLKEMGEAR